MEIEGSLSFALWIVAFGLASLAVQSWRELGICAVLATPFYWLVKWLAAGTALATDMLTWGGEPWKLSIRINDGFMAALALAAVTMILWRHLMIVRREKAGVP